MQSATLSSTLSLTPPFNTLSSASSASSSSRLATSPLNCSTLANSVGSNSNVISEAEEGDDGEYSGPNSVFGDSRSASPTNVSGDGAAASLPVLRKRRSTSMLSGQTKRSLEDDGEMDEYDAEENDAKLKRRISYRTKNSWEEDEHIKFMEGLELYGRDWQKISVYVGTTRDKTAIKSHAQKHFIKLMLAGKPLPAKVRESGDGYSISGRPLDPQASSVLAYAGNCTPPTVRLKSSTTGAVPDRTSNSEYSNSKFAESKYEEVSGSASRRKSPGDEKWSHVERQRLIDENLIMKDSRRSKTTNSYTPEQKSKSSNFSSSWYDSPTSLPATTPQSPVLSPYSFIECKKFSKCAKNSFTNQTFNFQPFSVISSSSAVFLMDLHAHICYNEAMGVLLGTFDGKVLSVTDAIPCTVELKERELTSEQVIQQTVAVVEKTISECVLSGNKQVVGWYISHPSYRICPTLADIEAHSRFAALSNVKNNNNNNKNNNNTNNNKINNNGNCAPFLGAILGAFDSLLPKEENIILWYYLLKADEESFHEPYELSIKQSTFYDKSEWTVTFDHAMKLLDVFSRLPIKTDSLELLWRLSTLRPEFDLEKTFIHKTRMAQLGCDDTMVTTTIDAFGQISTCTIAPRASELITLVECIEMDLFEEFSEEARSSPTRMLSEFPPHLISDLPIPSGSSVLSAVINRTRSDKLKLSLLKRVEGIPDQVWARDMVNKCVLKAIECTR